MNKDIARVFSDEGLAFIRKNAAHVYSYRFPKDGKRLCVYIFMNHGDFTVILDGNKVIIAVDSSLNIYNETSKIGSIQFTSEDSFDFIFGEKRIPFNDLSVNRSMDLYKAELRAAHIVLNGVTS